MWFAYSMCDCASENRYDLTEHMLSIVTLLANRDAKNQKIT